jgi:hypothetical protein
MSEFGCTKCSHSAQRNGGYGHVGAESLTHFAVMTEKYS